MFCQACGALNREDEEYCVRCNSKLLVLSGQGTDAPSGFEESTVDESFSFDEHLLERISILEEAVKRSAETIRELMMALTKQERSIVVNQTGVATLRELLETKRVVEGDEWNDLWQTRMDYQLLALEKRERFVEVKDRMVALFNGKRRKFFVELLDDAEYALFGFDVDRAMNALEAAYRLDKENYELAYFIGETYFNDGDTERALAYFTQVLEAAPEHYEGLVYTGVIQHERGDGESAEALLERALALHPDSFLPSFSLGAVFAARGNLTNAVTLLERAVSLDPVPEALFLLGSCYYEMGKPSRAARALEETVRRDPAHEEAHHLLGLAYLDRGWHQKALDAFRRAQRLNPKKLRYQDLVGYLSGHRESPLPEVSAEARGWLDKADQASTGARPDRVLSCYRSALDVEPDNPTLLINFALACLEHKRSKESEVVTRRLLELEPNEMLKATACATLIEALRTEGRFREGFRVGKRLLKEGSSSFARAIAYYEMAFSLAEMEEDLDEALDLARLSLESSPEELRQFPLAALGWVHYKRDEFEQAVDFLTRSTKLDPSAPTLTHLGMALLASGEDDEAKRVLAQAREAEGLGMSVQQKMMECMKDTNRLIERVQEKERR
ncbi:MAG: tetratricopeptide repeat protein [Thermoanaerobaculia bacterium]